MGLLDALRLGEILRCFSGGVLGRIGDDLLVGDLLLDLVLLEFDLPGGVYLKFKRMY